MFFVGAIVANADMMGRVKTLAKQPGATWIFEAVWANDQSESGPASEIGKVLVQGGSDGAASKII